MSYILDALKKSESERQRQQAAGQPRADVARAHAYHPSQGRLWRAALLLAGALLVAWWWFGGNTADNGEKAAVAASRPVSEPASGQGIAQQSQATDLANTDGLGMALVSEAEVETDPGHLRYENVPFLWELPAASAARMRAMSVTIHVYTRDQSGHILFINDRKYHQGERTPEGARIEAIVEQGVVMSYQGQYFKLSRPR